MSRPIVFAKFPEKGYGFVKRRKRKGYEEEGKRNGKRKEKGKGKEEEAIGKGTKRKERVIPEKERKRKGRKAKERQRKQGNIGNGLFVVWGYFWNGYHSGDHPAWRPKS